MVINRLRGTAVVETPRGILVVSQTGRRFFLPGGKARPRESGEAAAVRELREETGLKAVGSTYLFDHRGEIHSGPGGALYRDSHKVFLMTTRGVAEPLDEIRFVDFYGVYGLTISQTTKAIINRYRRLKAMLRIGPMKRIVSSGH